MRFLIDMPLPPELASWLSQHGHDAIHATEIGLAFAPDAVILEYARREQRTIITADLDYPRILALAKAEGPGLILFRNGNFSNKEVMDRLERAFNLIVEEEFANSIVVIEKKRIRKRNLPI